MVHNDVNITCTACLYFPIIYPKVVAHSTRVDLNNAGYLFCSTRIVSPGWWYPDDILCVITFYIQDEAVYQSIDPSVNTLSEYPQ